ncbi:hypothetical protein HY415_01010 [Candidatus Kaiserbacteria bacterium]|nr:hypothetical protein [Candidatus Kaiserbacteria bacterium]
MAKRLKKSSNYEPTLSDVLGAVQTGFAKVENRFDNVDGKINDLKYRVTAIEKRTGSIEETVEDMKDTLTGVARAVDKDTLTIMSHERRIRHLEKARV